MDTSNSPAAICNRALMAIGSDAELGDPDLQEGTKESRACLRVYGPVMRQLLRAAHWNFARKQAQLTLLNDATGQTSGAGTGTPGMGPWVYEYAWPTDGVKARYIPWQPLLSNTSPSGNIAIPATPLMTNLALGNQFTRPIPARFLVTTDNVPTVVGVPSTWADMPDWQSVQGAGPELQTVVLTNVQNANLVYTALIPYPNVWDPLFQEAMVAAVAERIAMQVLTDKKLAATVRGQQIAVAKNALDTARRLDGDEGWFSVDHTPDWIRARNTGDGGYAGTYGPWSGFGGGMSWCGWDSYSFGDGSSY